MENTVILTYIINLINKILAMVFSTIKQVIVFIPNKLTAINNAVDKVINIPETADKTFTYVSKVTGATTGAAGAAKGSVDFIEAVL